MPRRPERREEIRRAHPDAKKHFLESGQEKFDAFFNVDNDHAVNFAGVMREQSLKIRRTFPEFWRYTGENSLFVINNKLKERGLEPISKEELEAMYDFMGRR